HQSKRSQEQHDRERAAEDRLAERSQCGDTSSRIGDHGGVVGEPGDDAGQSDAGGHVIVDADHVGAQACIDRDSTRGAEAAGSYVTVVVRHRSFLSLMSRHLAGHVTRGGIMQPRSVTNLVAGEPWRQIWLDDGPISLRNINIRGRKYSSNPAHRAGGAPHASECRKNYRFRSTRAGFWPRAAKVPV